MITLKCRTPEEAFLVCDELEAADILTILPDQEELLLQYQRNGYVEVRVSARAYESLADLRSVGTTNWPQFAPSALKRRSYEARAALTPEQVFDVTNDSQGISWRDLPCSFAKAQPLATTQVNNLSPQPPHSRNPITLTVCVTSRPSTTSRQHHFHPTVTLYMERRIYFRRRVRQGPGIGIR